MVPSFKCFQCSSCWLILLNKTYKNEKGFQWKGKREDLTYFWALQWFKAKQMKQRIHFFKNLKLHTTPKYFHIFKTDWKKACNSICIVRSFINICVSIQFFLILSAIYEKHLYRASRLLSTLGMSQYKIHFIMLYKSFKA